MVYPLGRFAGRLTSSVDRERADEGPEWAQIEACKTGGNERSWGVCLDRFEENL